LARALVYLTWSFFRGPPAGRNPWGASGLEWRTASPPPVDNFEEPPIVTTGPYNYPKDGS
jgi:cytochrome c oxidase subunit 1